MNVLEKRLRATRDDGHKSLIGYVMGGIREDWPDLVRAMVDGGADAVEIGLPFSDPMLDGPVIQRASLTALQRGTQVERLLDHLPDVSVPLIAMSYSNHLFSRGRERFLQLLASAGIDGCIVPDLPLEESSDYLRDARSMGVAPVLMAAPSTPDETAHRIAQAAEGFVYCMGSMTPTGRTDVMRDDGWEIADRLKSLEGIPVMIGFGIDTPPRAALAARRSDGVVVGSALMDPVLAGATASSIMKIIRDFRRHIDDVEATTAPSSLAGPPP
ncbi:tryptophan synthase subunit alpha [Rhodococcus opacus]|uniref:tryptophan synthase subunit alpha n=1 Tax=Rhodococcus opacus TaxID=37919 RepID=UPI0027E00EEC|nr:tryptophan synthase subunit alpha [Rhodococcus opacus]